MLASCPCPNEGSETLDQPTASCQPYSSKPLCPGPSHLSSGPGEREHTARKKPVFGEDGYGVYEEDRDCLALEDGEQTERGSVTVDQVSETEEGKDTHFVWCLFWELWWS